MKRLFILALLLFCASAAQAQQPGSSLDRLKDLLGKWVGEGTSEVGAGGGFFTFESSLKDKVLVRKNHAEYPATKDRAAVIHDDLMVVYTDAATKRLRGFYTDSEGNTINYLVNVSENGKIFTFVSDPADPGPRYRLTYLVTNPGQITLTFEIASPDKPDQYRKFIEGRVHKVQ